MYMYFFLSFMQLIFFTMFLIYDDSSWIFIKGDKTFCTLIFGNRHHRSYHLLHHISNVFILFLESAWDWSDWILGWFLSMSITSQGFHDFLSWKNPNLLVCRCWIFHTARCTCNVTGSLYNVMQSYCPGLCVLQQFII